MNCIQFSFSIIISLLIASCSGHGQSEFTDKNFASRQLDKSEIESSKSTFSSEDSFRCGFADKGGNLWFGTNNNGIYRYDGNSFVNLTMNDGLNSNFVSSIMEDKKGMLWFGTDDGLCSFDTKTFMHIPIPFTDTTGVWLDKVYPVVNPNQVSSMIQDKNGDFWIGTNGAGVYHYDGATFSPHLSRIGRKQVDGLHHNIILSITEDKHGHIWFTSLTHAGIVQYDGNSYRQYMPEDGLSDDMYRSCYEDNFGNMWFGSNGNRQGGLDKFDGDNFTYYNEEDGICNTNIACIYEDGKGILWLGSGRNGICLFDGKTFTPFLREDGSNFSGINFIIEDRSGNIWFGGQYGKLYRYDGENVCEFI